MDYWREFGRHYYTRYDYEGVETAQADALIDGLREKVRESQKTHCSRWRWVPCSECQGGGDRAHGRVRVPRPYRRIRLFAPGNPNLHEGRSTHHLQTLGNRILWSHDSNVHGEI